MMNIIIILFELNPFLVFSSFVLLVLAIIFYIKGKITTDIEKQAHYFKRGKQFIIAFVCCFFIGKGLELMFYDIIASC